MATASSGERLADNHSKHIFPPKNLKETLYGDSYMLANILGLCHMTSPDHIPTPLLLLLFSKT